MTQPFNYDHKIAKLNVIYMLGMDAISNADDTSIMLVLKKMQIYSKMSLY